MAKVRVSAGKEPGWFIFCPACRFAHRFVPRMPDGSPGWTFNGDLDRPTFTPSMLIHPVKDAVLRCHSYVTNGRIEFLSDCEHNMRLRTVDLPEFPDGYHTS